MSSNKTIIPGMENYNSDSPSTFKEKTGTKFVPDGVSQMTKPTPNTPLNHKPIVGFLYSVSRTIAGEYWPLKIGANTIGRSSDCDIDLEEGTVSERHAELVVRQMKNPEKMIASIYDVRSTCGTMINGVSLGFEPRECISGDILTIGNHYDLYVILIDSKEVGLNRCSDFISTKPETAPHVPHTNNETSGFTPVNEVPVHHGGTVILGESEDEDSIPVSPQPHSGTIFM